MAQSRVSVRPTVDFASQTTEAGRERGDVSTRRGNEPETLTDTSAMARPTGRRRRFPPRVTRTAPTEAVAREDIQHSSPAGRWPAHVTLVFSLPGGPGKQPGRGHELRLPRGVDVGPVSPAVGSCPARRLRYCHGRGRGPPGFPRWRPLTSMSSPGPHVELVGHREVTAVYEPGTEAAEGTTLLRPGFGRLASGPGGKHRPGVSAAGLACPSTDHCWGAATCDQG